MATNPDLQSWNRRFETADFVFGEAPNEMFRRYLADMTAGRALCVADGEGRNGVWAAEKGWSVLSLDFSDVAQRKARDLAARRGVTLELVQADVHSWAYPTGEFDLVADVFSQFSTPDQRAQKWAGMVQALKPGGSLMVVGYTPKQLEYRTGGPSAVENLYTAQMLQDAFDGLRIDILEEKDMILSEGPGHSGMSAVIGLVAVKV